MKPYNESPAHRLRSAYLRMHRATNRVFRPYGVTADQYVVLRFLSEGDGMSQQELASLCASDPTTLGRMLDLLEAKNFLERRQHPEDRRTRLVFLRDEGRDMVEQLYEVAEPIRSLIDEVVSGAAMKSLLRGLSQLSDAFAAIEAGSARLEPKIGTKSPLSS